MSQIPGPPMQQALPPAPGQPSPRNKPAGGLKVVIAALVMALLAVVILSVYIQGVKDQVAAKQFTVYVLNRSVLPNQPVKQDWEAIQIPDRKEFRDAFGKGLNAVMDEGELKAKMQLGDRYGAAAPRGAIITHALFDQDENTKDLKPKEGLRRKALPINSKSTPGGLRPGDYVDLAAPILTGGSIPQMMIVMEGVEVKAIGTHTLVNEYSSNGGRSTRNYSTVSFDVDQGTAIKLSTLEKMVRPVGEFELYITRSNQRPSWQGGGINPKVLEEIDKMLPTRRGG